MKAATRMTARREAWVNRFLPAGTRREESVNRGLTAPARHTTAAPARHTTGAPARHTTAASACLVALVLLTLFAFVAPTARSAEPAGAPKKVVTIEGITEYRLDNGLRVLLFPDPSASTVTVNCTVFVGSRHEGYGETGMAHLLEHMVFKGTPTHPDVPKALRDHGAQFNGTTWVDRTNYFETMPASDANLEFGIRLEADRLVNSWIKREDLASEMTVVRNEFEQGENNPEYILSQRMMAVAFEWHNYGKSTIGNRSDIERVPIERLQAFYRKYYQPDNALLIVAGKFDEAKALEYIGKYFGPLKKPARSLDRTYTEEPPQDGERTVVLRRVGKVAVAGLIYHIPAGSHEDFAAVEVLNSILVSEPSGRLYQALVPVKKANTVSGAAYAWHDPGVIEFQASVDDPRKLEALRDTMIDVVENLAKQKISEEEVTRARNKFTRDRELLMSRSNRIGIELSEWAALGDWRLFFLHRDRMAKVTPADVARVAQKYLQPSNRTVGLFIPTDQPQRTPVPPTPVVADLVKDYKGTETVSAGEAFDPTPENIQKRLQRADFSPTFKVALLPKKTRGEVAVLRLSLHFGNEKSLQPYTAAADLLGELMSRGTRKHTRQQIEDELDRLGARASISSDAGILSVTVQVKRANLPAVVALLGEVLREPTFPADELDILKRETREQYTKSLTEPDALASQALRRKLRPYPQDDIRYQPTLEEQIARLDGVTVEQCRKVYEQVGGQVGELVLVGDFDPAVVGQVQNILKDWKSPVPYERIARTSRTDIAGSREVIQTPDKENAMYLAGHLLAMTDNDPDYAALQTANFIFGGASLSSRLANRVRQKDGLSYGIASIFGADSIDKDGRFLIYAIANPENLPKVDQAIAEELARFLKEGVTADELAAAQKALLQQRQVGRSSDVALASQLADALYADRPFTWHADLERKIAALTPQDLAQAVKKHLDPKRLVIIHAGDFKKPKK